MAQLQLYVCMSSVVVCHRVHSVWGWFEKKCLTTVMVSGALASLVTAGPLPRRGGSAVARTPHHRVGPRLLALPSISIGVPDHMVG